MTPIEEAILKKELSNVSTFLFNKVKNSIFRKESIEESIIIQTDFKKIIEDKIDFEEIPEIPYEDINAICYFLSKKADIELIINQLYVFQSSTNKSLDEIREDFISLFPEKIESSNREIYLRTEERASFLLKVFEVLDGGIQETLNRATSESSLGAVNALNNRRYFDTKNDLRDIKRLIKNGPRGPQEKKHLDDKLPSLFISYAREDDEPFVGKLYQDLIANGFDVWWDRTSMKNRGRTFLQEIRDAIENSDHVIAMIGPKAIESDYVRYEWEHALLYSKNVIPILRIGDYTLLPPEMSELHCPDFRANRFYKNAFEELIRLLRDPIPPLGLIYSVPSFPPNYLPRTEDLNKIKELILADTIKPVVITSAKQVTALQGMGGMGKSVLAAAFARTIEVRKAFYDGIFWTTVGLDADESNLIAYMKRIGTKFGDESANYSSKEDAKDSIQKILSDKVCLIILDDIWKISQAEPFRDALGQRCRLLITTRNEDVVTSLGAYEHKIKVLSESEALNLLANWCEKDANSLPLEAKEVAKECGYLPLALSMCGAMAAKSGNAWSDILEALQEADLEYIEAQLPNYQNSNVMKAFKVSIDFLTSEDPDAVQRYQELAVLPTDESVPEAALATLWAHTGNLKKRNSRKLLTKLKDRALLRLDGEAPNRIISLHDLQLDYLRGTAYDLSCLHNQLLEAYSKECGNNWSAGPADGYFFEYLAYHLVRAGKKEELRKILFDFNWIQSKLNATDVHFLINDYGYFPEDYPVQMVKGAIQLSANALSKDKKLLGGQLLGRLELFSETEIKLLMGYIREHKNGMRIIPLIGNLTPPGGSLLRTLEGHSLRVTAVSVTPDGDAISASWDKTLKVWDIKTGKEKHTLKGHSSRVNAVTVTPDGNYAVSASDDYTLKVWNIKTGREVHTLTGHSSRVNAVTVTPDGNYAVSASDDYTLKVWNIKTGKEVHTLTGHSSRVNAVTVTPDGIYAVSASGDKTLKVWNIKTGEEVRTFTGHSGWVYTVSVTSDGNYIVSTSDDTTLKVWNFKTGKEVHTLTGHSSRVNAVSITPNGNYAVSASDDKKLKVWDLGSGDEKTTLEGHSSRVNAVTVTHDGNYVVSASDDTTLIVWDIKTGREVLTLKGHSSIATAFSFTPDGCAVSASDDTSLKVWDIKIRNEVLTLKSHSLEVTMVSVTPDGNYVVSASGDRTLIVWDTKTGKEVCTLTGHLGWINAVAVTSDGNYVVSASWDGMLKVWDLKTGKEVHTLKGHSSRVNAVTVTLDGIYAVSASDDTTLRVWDIKMGKEVHTLKGHSSYIYGVSITPDGNYAVSASGDGTRKVWDLKTGKEVHTLIGYSSMVNAVSVTPDGIYAISSSDDYTLKVWDIKTGKEVHILTGHSGWVNEFSVTSDGNYAISASDDTTLKVWNIKTGKEVHTLTGHSHKVNAVSVTSDGNYAVSASDDNTIKVWDIKRGMEISAFSGDSIFTCVVFSRDNITIVAGERNGEVHFLLFEK